MSDATMIASEPTVGTWRTLWLAAGWSSVALAGIGAVLPLMPTTVFLLIAAYCFARGCSRTHAWLMAHRHFGPPIQAWQRSRAIPRQAKHAASLAMALSLAVTWLVGVPPVLIAVQAIVLTLVAAFIWSRPDPATIQTSQTGLA